MSIQTYISPDISSIQSYDYTPEQRQVIEANLAQAELDQGDLLAIELQKGLNGMELFRSSPLYLTQSTLQQVQSSIEPFYTTYKLLLIVNDPEYRHTCPICKSPENVVKNGRVQRKCKNDHDQTKSEYGHNYYSGPTSLEAQHLVILLGYVISLQLYGNSTHNFINQLYGVSTYIVEFTSSFLADNLPKLSVSDLDLTSGFAGYDDLLVVFCDFSGSRLSKKTSLLATEINGEVVWYMYHSPNSIVAGSMVKDLEKEISKQGFEGQIVFITDGELCWLDPIRDTFTNAIHIRQFHKKSILGTVFIHFMHNGQEHTLKCRWDLVKDKVFEVSEVLEQRVEEFEASEIQRIEDSNINQIFERANEQISEATFSKREWRKQVREKIDHQDDQSEEDDIPGQYDITLYQSRVLTTRGNRKNSGSKGQSEGVNTTADGYKEGELPEVETQSVCDEETTDTANIGSSDVRDGVDRDSEVKKNGKRTPNSSILYQGHVKEGIKKHPWLERVYMVIVAIFGGLYITSNRAENPFQIKHRLGSHGTLKAGVRHLQMQLGFARFSNLDAFRDWLDDNLDKSSLLFHEIIRDRTMVTQNNSRKELMLHLQAGKYLVIGYTNREGESSMRVLKILEKVQKNGVFKAYCYLRSEARNFQVSRIQQFCTLEEYIRYLERSGRLDIDVEIP